MKFKYKKIAARLIILLCAAALLGFLLLLKNSVKLSEYVFSRGISRWYITAVSAVSSLFPFSVLEAIIYAVIILAVILIIRWLHLFKIKRGAKALSGMLTAAAAAVMIGVLYTVTASFAYNRAPLPVPAHSGAVLEAAEAEKLVQFYLADFIKVGAEVKRKDDGTVDFPYSDKEISEILVSEYGRVGTFGGYLSKYTPPVKGIGFSLALDYQHIAGVTFTVTGEANLNRHTPPLWKIHTAAHELAHIKGVMREDDANLLANYLMLTSGNIYFRYAFYAHYFDRVLSIIRYDISDEEYDAYRAQTSFRYPDLRADYEFWSSFESPIDKISAFINDIYLKMSGQKDGTASYGDYDNVTVVPDPDTGAPKPVLKYYSPLQSMLVALYAE